MRRFALISLSVALLPLSAFAQSSESPSSMSSESSSSSESSVSSSSSVAGVATITIEQIAVKGSLGSWLLSVPDHTQRSGTEATMTLEEMPSGSYVVFAELPSGTKSTIRIYRNGVADTMYERSQTPFPVAAGENIRIAIHYFLDRTGTISVQTDPAGAAFTLTGPDGFTETGVTPQTYDGLPEGQYKVQYESFGEGCVKPAPKANQLVEDGRVTFELRYECDAATKVRNRVGKDTKVYLTIVADGEEITLQDVKQSDWFSTYVFDAARRDILSGYRDASGKLTGEFGPGNNVTVAELSKIAHRMAGLSEEPFATVTPKNPLAPGYWFSAFIGSSENRGWTIYTDATIDPTRPATRGEVIVTLLQAFDVPLSWQKGNVFNDVPVTTPYAAAIETAAAAEVIAGRTGEDGKSTGMFDPSASITRAEIAKIIVKILETYDSPTTVKNAAERRANED